MYKKILSLTLIFLLITGALMFTACSKANDNNSGDTEAEEMAEEEFVEYDDDPVLDNESDEAELTLVGHEEKDFYGSWSATSEQAHYLFGNVDLVINEDGTWSGNIVEEDFSGKWTYEDSTLMIKSSDELINWQLFFVEDGSLMFKDLDDPDLTPLVLRRQ